MILISWIFQSREDAVLYNTPQRWHPVKKPAWIAIRVLHIDYLICTV